MIGLIHLAQHSTISHNTILLRACNVILVPSSSSIIHPHMKQRQSVLKLPAQKHHHKTTTSSSSPLNAAKSIHDAHLLKTNQLTIPNSQQLHNKAHYLFNQITWPNLSHYNHILRGLNADPLESIRLFKRLCQQGLRGNHSTFLYVFKACGRVLDIQFGNAVRGHVLKLGFGSDLFVNNGGLFMYGVLGDLGSARKVFDEMGVRDLVSWNSLICGFARWGMRREVLLVFGEMRREGVKGDAVTMVKVLLACRDLRDWGLVDEVVGYMERESVEVDVYVGNTLIDIYGQRGMVDSAKGVFCGMEEKNVVSWNSMLMVYVKTRDLLAARRFFDEMPSKDAVSWTSMVTGYTQGSRFEEAVRLFKEMMADRVKPDEVTVASVLSACAHLGALDVGLAVHEYIREHGIPADIYVGNSLIDMYCKCGVIDKALKVFYGMKEKDSVSYTAMISGLAVNGNAESALELFSKMLRNFIQPTHGAFVAILLACAHAGLVEKGMEYFESMQKDYGLIPEMKHYGCIVDLLSRSGNLERAHEFVKRMPLDPDVTIWRILLSACKVHKNMVLAEIVQRKLLNLDPHNSGNYILLCNAYAGSNRWEDAVRMRELMEEGNVQKPSAWSSIEVNSGVIKKLSEILP